MKRLSLINTVLAVIALLGFVVPVYRLSVTLLGVSESTLASILSVSPVLALLCILLLIVFIVFQFTWRKNWQNFFFAFVAAGPFLVASPDDFNDSIGTLSYLPTICLPIIASAGMVLSAIIAYAMKSNKPVNTEPGDEEMDAKRVQQKNLRWRGLLLWGVALTIASFSVVLLSLKYNIEYLWMGGSFLLIAAAVLIIWGIVGLIINRATIRQP